MHRKSLRRPHFEKLCELAVECDAWIELHAADQLMKTRNPYGMVVAQFRDLTRIRLCKKRGSRRAVLESEGLEKGDIEGAAQRILSRLS